MIPVLFEIGPIKVNSFGLMLGIAFLAGNYILAREFRLKKLNPDFAGSVTIVALIFGLLGAKLLHVIEHMVEYWGTPNLDIADQLFSFSGLTWYGGFVLGMAALYVYIRSKKIPYLSFLDSLGIALILAYGIGRVGCHLAGDGDYGIPTTLPWGTIYAEGTAKPSRMLREYFDRNPETRQAWAYDSLRAIPGGTDSRGNPITRFDVVTPCHPTPIYELLLGIAGFVVLLNLRTRGFPDGKLFAIYLMLASAFRFSVEFLRLQPKIVLGLSEAQLISIVLFVFGLGWMMYLDRKRTGSTAGTP